MTAPARDALQIRSSPRRISENLPRGGMGSSLESDSGETQREHGRKQLYRWQHHILSNCNSSSIHTILCSDEATWFSIAYSPTQSCAAQPRKLRSSRTESSLRTAFTVILLATNFASSALSCIPGISECSFDYGPWYCTWHCQPRLRCH